MSPLECALEALDEYCVKNKHPEIGIVRARTRSMMRAYDYIYGEQNLRFEVLGVEKLLLAPLINLQTKKDSGYIAGGKLDVFLREMDGRKRLCLLDHKYLYASFDQDDIEHLLVSGQLNQYGYLGWLNKYKFEDAIWDIIAKPIHVPHKEHSCVVRAAKAERIASRKTTIDGKDYVKGDLLPAEPEVRKITPAETLEEFEQRVFETLIENKDKYFARPRVPMLKQNIADHIHEQYLWTKELDMDSRSDTHLRNTDSCKMYNRPCEYLGLCTGKSSIDDGTWINIDKTHAELDLPEGVDPHKVITNSRMSCYKACRLKHHRRYNLGLRKNKEDQDDNLYVGSAGHVAQEMYWRAIARSQGRNL